MDELYGIVPAKKLVSKKKKSTGLYRSPFCMAWAQLPLGKASGKRGPGHGTHAHGWVLPWGISPALYLGHFETCFLLKLPHSELRQQRFTAYL